MIVLYWLFLAVNDSRCNCFRHSLLSADVLLLDGLAGHFPDPHSVLDIFELKAQVLSADGQSGSSLPRAGLRKQLDQDRYGNYTFFHELYLKNHLQRHASAAAETFVADKHKRQHHVKPKRRSKHKRVIGFRGTAFIWHSHIFTDRCMKIRKRSLRESNAEEQRENRCTSSEQMALGAPMVC